MRGSTISSGVSPANTISLSKRRYEIRSEDGARLLNEVRLKMAEAGISRGLYKLVRSGGGDYLIRSCPYELTAVPRALRAIDRRDVMAPATVEQLRDIRPSGTLVQHRGEQTSGRVQRVKTPLAVPVK
jgi:hypothetical protein